MRLTPYSTHTYDGQTPGGYDLLIWLGWRIERRPHSVTIKRQGGERFVTFWRKNPPYKRKR
jgi:hypothetical protein